MIAAGVIATAQPSDLAAILALEEAGFDSGARWTEASWLDELRGTDRRVLVDRDGGELRGAATFQLVAGTADLHRVVVAPAHRGRGIGRALVEAGIAWAERSSAGAKYSLFIVQCSLFFLLGTPARCAVATLRGSLFARPLRVWRYAPPLHIAGAGTVAEPPF